MSTEQAWAEKVMAVEAERDRLREALVNIEYAPNAATTDDLRRMAYEAHTGEKR